VHQRLILSTCELTWSSEIKCKTSYALQNKKERKKEDTQQKKKYNKNQEQQYKNTISFKDLKILSKQDPEKKLLLSMATLVAWLLDLNAHQEYLRMI